MQYLILTDYIDYFDNPNNKFSCSTKNKNIFTGNEYLYKLPSTELFEFFKIFNNYYHIGYFTSESKNLDNYYNAGTANNNEDSRIKIISNFNKYEVFRLLTDIFWVPYQTIVRDAEIRYDSVIEKSEDGTVAALLKRLKEIDNSYGDFYFYYANTANDPRQCDYTLSIETHVDGTGIIKKNEKLTKHITKQDMEYVIKLFSLVDYKEWRGFYYIKDDIVKADFDKNTIIDERKFWTIKYSQHGEELHSSRGILEIPKDFNKLAAVLFLIDPETQKHTQFELEPIKWSLISQ